MVLGNMATNEDIMGKVPSLSNENDTTHASNTHNSVELKTPSGRLAEVLDILRKRRKRICRDLGYKKTTMHSISPEPLQSTNTWDFFWTMLYQTSMVCAFCEWQGFTTSKSLEIWADDACDVLSLRILDYIREVYGRGSTKNEAVQLGIRYTLIERELQGKGIFVLLPYVTVPFAELNLRKS